MDNWNQLLVALDKTVGFPNKISSTVKKRWQGYDMWKNEHVIWLEYRTKVDPGIRTKVQQAQVPREFHRDPVGESGTMRLIRELMDVRCVNAVDSSPSRRSLK